MQISLLFSFYIQLIVRPKINQMFAHYAKPKQTNKLIANIQCGQNLKTEHKIKMNRSWPQNSHEVSI